MGQLFVPIEMVHFCSNGNKLMYAHNEGKSV